jgi:hypothetical protein
LIPGRYTKLGLLLVLVLPIVAACSGGDKDSFPSFAYASSQSLESYRAAASLPRDVLESIPCYCGCVNSEPAHHHLRDCFYEADGSYSEHAASCDLCGKIVFDVRDSHEKGDALVDIRHQIDSGYSVYGRPTETPPVG